MKNKFIILTLCFTIIFSNINLSNYKSYANNYEPMAIDGGVISAPMVATIVTLAAASGVVLSSNDDIYDICNYFYSQHKENWQPVVDVFNACVEIGANGVVTVGKEFLDLVSSSFDSLFNTNKSNINLINGIPLSPGYISFPVPAKDSKPITYSTGIMAENFDGASGFLRITFGYRNGYPTHPYTASVSVGDKGGGIVFKSSTTSMNVSLKPYGTDSLAVVISGQTVSIPFTTEDYRYSLPASPSYDSSIMKDKESLGIYVPGNVDTLVGGNLLGSDVVYEGALNPPYDLPIGGVVSLPGVDSPTVDVTDDVFPGVVSPPSDIPGDIPGDTPGIVFPPFGGGLDFSPITQSSFVDKFPFSLAKDIKNIVSVFDVEPKAPKFTVPIVSEELEIDLTQFNIWASIIRFFVLIGFMIALINITRKVIG